MNYLGVDPGLTGYICKLTEEGQNRYFPIAKFLKRIAKTDLIYLTDIPMVFNNIEAIAFEDPGTIRTNIQSSKLLWKSAALVENYIIPNALRVNPRCAIYAVNPQVWQRQMGQPKFKVSSDRKQWSIDRALELDPDIQMNHDKAESLILANYAKLRLNNLL